MTKKLFSETLFLFLIKWTQKSLYHLGLYEEVRSSTRFAKKLFGDKPLIVVEIGTQRGANARSICNNLNVKKIYCIDPYDDYIEKRQDGKHDLNFSRFLATAKDRLKGYPVVIIEKYSADAIDDIPDNADFIYIDGNHDCEFVREDITLYYKKLRSGGVLAGHDFCGNFLGVVYAVIEFTDGKGLKLHTKHADWWFVKP